ncbi:VIT1/CCC1 transporter family protein [Actinacidiphila rubida]|uniref:Predicted Fe2+/Mn2+ transporter, VIT1/CCC1 family n=1 Tax=Actinacidiphila rubida TaxID=310780 RepID=A0A1H8SDW7_9ACTN|nr:VIT1/CCC1 transporter family protein [Actinacidiphila rubida]SEO76544.1 Predicted Fe2+/Mn2+ transporter, VIT1/CCC1 family [Actinacidiphila rubida]
MTATADLGTPEIHHQHRDVTGGWLRPATFGVVDGLVSNFALVAGVVGGGAGAHAVVLTGLAGLTAGACSMATGEFVSVSSQNELAQAEIARERRELATNPQEELRELTLAYEAKGVRPELAAEIARELTADPEVAWRVHVREELGVDPDDLPSGWTAAASSFAAFALGALVPLLPFFFGASTLAAALIASSAALIVTGGLTARLTARSEWFGASRQLVLGGLSAAVTFGVGLLVGTGVS